MAEKGLVLDDDFWSNVRIDNQSGVELSRGDITERLRGASEIAAMSDWLNDVHGTSSSTGKRKGTLWDRDKYVTPSGVFAQYAVSLRAAEHDDVVSGVVESTEGLVFSKMSMEAEEDDQEDVWNQIERAFKDNQRVKGFIVGRGRQVPLAQAPDDVVQGSAHVVDSIPKHQRPMARQWPGVVREDVPAARIPLLLTSRSERVLLGELVDFEIERMGAITGEVTVSRAGAAILEPAHH